MGRLCEVRDCRRQHYAHGMCLGHYLDWWKTNRNREVRICEVEDCDRPQHARDWCRLHYRRWERYGDPLWQPRSYVKRAPTCTVAGCGKRHEARGWCAMHYQRWRVYGDPLHDPAWSRRHKTGRPASVSTVRAQPRAYRPDVWWCEGLTPEQVRAMIPSPGSDEMTNYDDRASARTRELLRANQSPQLRRPYDADSPPFRGCAPSPAAEAEAA